MVYKVIAKIVLIGDGAVGKTALRTRYMGLGFKGDYMMTVGADFGIFAQPVTTKGKEFLVKFQIWDLAGQERFSTVRASYYNGTKGIVLVYDVCRWSSFQNLVKWVRECSKQLHGKLPPLVLVANKIDLRSQFASGTAVDIDTGRNLAIDLADIFKIPVNFYETSARTGINVKEMFISLAEMITSKMI